MNKNKTPLATLKIKRTLFLMTPTLSALEFLSQVNDELKFSPPVSPKSLPQFTFTQELLVPSQLKLEELFAERTIPIEQVIIKDFNEKEDNAFQFLGALNVNSSFIIDKNNFETRLVKKKPSWLQTQLEIANCVTLATMIRARHTY